MCGAAAAHNGKLSHFLFFLKEVKRLDNAGCESTEDILAEITDMNENCEIGETDKLVVGSLDVKALCPSLDVNFTSERVADDFYSSPVSVDTESVDLGELGLCLALHIEEDELS